MKKFLVIVNNKYLTSVEANSHGDAEHRILDLCTIEGGITSCQAFSEEDLKTDTFVCNAINCKAISFDEMSLLCDMYENSADTLGSYIEELKRHQADKKELERELQQKKDMIAALEDEYKIAFDHMNSILH